MRPGPPGPADRLGPGGQAGEPPLAEALQARLGGTLASWVRRLRAAGLPAECPEDALAPEARTALAELLATLTTPASQAPANHLTPNTPPAVPGTLGAWALASIDAWRNQQRPWEDGPADAAFQTAQAHRARLSEPFAPMAAPELPLPDDDQVRALVAKAEPHRLTAAGFRTYALLEAARADLGVRFALRRLAPWCRRDAVPVRVAVRVANPVAGVAASNYLLPEALAPRARGDATDLWVLGEAFDDAAPPPRPLAKPINAADAAVADLPQGIIARVPPLPEDRIALVVDELTDAEMRHVAARIRHRAVVQAGASSLFVLFAGESGHGKRTAIRIIAERAGLELLSVRSGAVSSRWAGETEQRISALFSRVARSGGALLIEDAADLFAPRTAVTQVTDRYSNMMTNHLLSAVDTFEGVCFLTGPGLASFEPAMRRRIAVTVTFPPATPEMRGRILERATAWVYRRAPDLVPGKRPDWVYLGRLALGLRPAQLARIALDAGLEAAVAKEKLDFARLARTLRREVERAGGLGLPS